MEAIPEKRGLCRARYKPRFWTTASNYAGLAEMQRAWVDELGAFDVALIEEAVSLAAKLRDQSAKKIAGGAPRRATAGAGPA